MIVIDAELRRVCNNLPSNKDKNRRIRRITRGAQVQGEHWLELSQDLEKVCNDRLHQLENHGEWKKKNKKLIAKDKAFKTVIQEFKASRINHEEYVRKIVKLNRESDLPRGRRAVMRLLESDSD